MILGIPDIVIAFIVIILDLTPFFLLAWLCSIVSRAGDRKRIRRFLHEAGFTPLSFKRIQGHENHDDYIVRYLADGVETEAAFRTLDGHHFYIVTRDAEASHLVFFKKDGSTHLYQIPDANLDAGQYLYYRRYKKNNIAVCLANAALALVGSAAVTMLVVYASMTLLRALSPSIGSSPTLDAIMLVIIAALVLLVILIPMFCAVAAYRLTRFESIISDTPICLNCGYDLRGNESNTCPECGRLIAPEVAVADDQQQKVLNVGNQDNRQTARHPE